MPILEVTQRRGTDSDAQQSCSNVHSRPVHATLLLGADTLEELQTGLKILSEAIGDNRFVTQDGVVGGMFKGPDDLIINYFLMMGDSSTTFLHFNKGGDN